MEAQLEGAQPEQTRSGEEAQTAELIERWRGGDLQAREQLVERSLPQLRSQARSFALGLGRASGAHPTELVQETWLRALSTVPAAFEARRPGALAGYLWRLLQRTVLDRYRRACRHKHGANELLANGDGGGENALYFVPDPHADSPTANARAAEWLGLVRSLLSEREWELWRRVEIEGSSIAEAARARAESESAARGVLHRARARLLERLCDDAV